MFKVIRKILSLLSSGEKKSLGFLSVFMVFNALLEVLGIASIAPLIAVIVNPESLETLPILNDIYVTYEFKDFQKFTILLGGVILCIILVSNSMMLMTNYFSVRYANNREYTIGRRLLETYIYQPYSFFLERHSTDLLRNIFNEVSYVVSNVIMQLLYLLSRSISVVSILVFIFVVNPQVTIMLGLILGGAYGAIYLFLKTRLYRLGKESVAATQEKLRTITDSIRVIRDIKMLRIENIFLKKYDVEGRHYARVKTLSDLYAVAPRYIIEVFAIFALVFAVIYLSATRDNANEILPVLGVYTFAGYRLMPALQMIFNALSKIQFSSHSLDIIAGELQDLQSVSLENKNRKKATVPCKKNFSLKDISFRYRDKDMVLHGVNLSVQKGEKVGIIGESGGGKSTLIDLLAGLSKPEEGGLYIDGKLLPPSDYAGWRQNISYVSQNVYLLDDTVDMNISMEMQGGQIDRARAKHARELALVDEFLEEMGEDSSLVTGENGIRLSGGQRQRIGIARALYQDKDILILDEATSALDVHTEKRLLDNIVRQKSKTLIFITHRVETLSFCDRIYVVSEGKIADSGSYDDLQERSSYFKNW